MKAYLISCQFKNSVHNYQSLNAEIRKLGSGCHCIDSIWIIKSSLSSTQIATLLKPFVYSGDKFIVIGINQDASWLGFDENCTSWLQSNL
ncbi:hypothetical protein SAMN05216167_15022 [Spirosoma endophyticum]|uniref:SinR family protein n=1 Tax=Spirosoma endophyticum TaxID=662367 RepID=A0A1I2HVZ7_9BACT|nr:hypothetical protein SAMN05216167_15022 [Spirosoma endophyticum]